MFEDIFEVLSTQYRKAREMLAAMRNIPPQETSERRKMGLDLARELISLDEAEAQVLYKRLEEFDQLRSTVRQYREKQNQIDEAVWRLLNMDPDDPDWQTRLSELSDKLEEHIANEEENLFQSAAEVLAKDEARAMVETYLPLQDRRRHQVQP
jgi:hemerythrin-like domain-containing protein